MCEVTNLLTPMYRASEKMLQ